MEQVLRPFQILGSGVYLPEHRLKSEELDRRFDLPQGTVAQKWRVLERPIANRDETISKMAKWAVEAALKDAGLHIDDLDLLISAGATKEQLLPYQASAIHRELGLQDHGLPCFDVDTTCLSFVTALDIASYQLAAGTAKRIAVVSSEAPSVAVNWDQIEQATLFGDGAACFILGEDPSGKRGLTHSYMRTYSSGYHTCEIQAGGTRYNIVHPPPTKEHYFFSMSGKSAFKLFSEMLPVFLRDLEKRSKKPLREFDWVVPHQASPLALGHFVNATQIPEERFVNILATYGNQVAASIPIALHGIRADGRAKPGHHVCLFGTSAGLSIASLGLII